MMNVKNTIQIKCKALGYLGYGKTLALIIHVGTVERTNTANPTTEERWNKKFDEIFGHLNKKQWTTGMKAIENC